MVTSHSGIAKDEFLEEIIAILAMQKRH